MRAISRNLFQITVHGPRNQYTKYRCPGGKAIQQIVEIWAPAPPFWGRSQAFHGAFSTIYRSTIHAPRPRITGAHRLVCSNSAQYKFDFTFNVYPVGLTVNLIYSYLMYSVFNVRKNRLLKPRPQGVSRLSQNASFFMYQNCPQKVIFKFHLIVTKQSNVTKKNKKKNFQRRIEWAFLL